MNKKVLAGLIVMSLVSAGADAMLLRRSVRRCGGLVRRALGDSVFPGFGSDQSRVGSVKIYAATGRRCICPSSSFRPDCRFSSPSGFVEPVYSRLAQHLLAEYKMTEEELKAFVAERMSGENHDLLMPDEVQRRYGSNIELFSKYALALAFATIFESLLPKIVGSPHSIELLKGFDDDEESDDKTEIDYAALRMEIGMKLASHLLIARNSC